MKIQFETGDSKYIYYAIFVVAFVALSAFHRNRTSGLKDTIKVNDVKIATLTVDKNNLLQSVANLELEKAELLKRADSFEVKEKYYKYKFYSTNEKLKKTLATYSSSTTDDKNKLFTGDLLN